MQAPRVLRVKKYSRLHKALNNKKAGVMESGSVGFSALLHSTVEYTYQSFLCLIRDYLDLY